MGRAVGISHFPVTFSSRCSSFWLHSIQILCELFEFGAWPAVIVVDILKIFLPVLLANFQDGTCERTSIIYWNICIGFCEVDGENLIKRVCSAGRMRLVLILVLFFAHTSVEL